MHCFWQLGDELRGQLKVPDDQKWSMVASKLAEQTRLKGERMNNLDLSKAPAETRLKGERMNNLDLSKAPAETRPKDKFGFQEVNKFESLDYNMLNLDFKMTENMSKSSCKNDIYNLNAYQKNNQNLTVGMTINKYNGNNVSNKDLSNNNNNNNNKENAIANNAVDKRFKTLLATETLPRNEVLGGYIFVCNNDTMQEDLKRQLFGLPPRYRDSVRAITPGLPLFLYNYTTHQLHGIFEAASFGGSNIDPTAWEDKKCRGESRFPAQVKIHVRKICKALEEDAFRPVLHHYDGPKFRLELSVPETLDLLDLCEQSGTAA